MATGYQHDQRALHANLKRAIEYACGTRPLHVLTQTWDYNRSLSVRVMWPGGGTTVVSADLFTPTQVSTSDIAELAWLVSEDYNGPSRMEHNNFHCYFCAEPTDGDLMCFGCGEFWCPDCLYEQPHCCDHVEDWQVELAVNGPWLENAYPTPQISVEARVSEWGQDQLTMAQQFNALQINDANAGAAIAESKSKIRTFAELSGNEAVKLWATELERAAMKNSLFEQLAYGKPRGESVIIHHMDDPIKPRE